jgi:hypothetical protein
MSEAHIVSSPTRVISCAFFGPICCYYLGKYFTAPHGLVLVGPVFSAIPSFSFVTVPGRVLDVQARTYTCSNLRDYV